ncbi:hypothetical protein ON010_g6309 [Phytophthora cinnamomi]|nr:hypothetical protein ON010_g6309 [Phytophthora cinnamomi]
MSSSEFQATATQLLHRQSSSQQHLRQYTFAATIAAYRVEQLENELAEAERLRVLKEERDASRMERKLQHVAAAYIQYIWRRYCQLKKEEAYRQSRAERLVVDFLSYRSWRRKTVRHQASFRIQRKWQRYQVEKKAKLSLAVVGNFLLPLIRARRARAQLNAVRIQRWYRHQRSRRRNKSARMIQRAWRISVSKAKIRYYSRAYRHLANLKRLERSARVLQRALGQRILQRRLLHFPEFDEYPSVMAVSWPPLRPAEERAQEFWLHEKRALEEATAERKQLEKGEITLQSDIEGLQRRLADAKLRRGDESDRLGRHLTLEEHRRLKDEECKQRRLQELEETMRRSIRLELERELETARRLIRAGGHTSSAGCSAAVSFAKFSGLSESGDLRERLVADILTCGVELHVILSTLRFREELVQCRRALLPSYDSDSETDSELDSDGDEGMAGETGEFTVEDTLWITDQVAKEWGLTQYQYFLLTSGQEYAFSAWSYRGIGNFMHALLTNEQRGANALPAVVSPYSWLFHVAAYSHYMIHSEDHQILGLIIVYLLQERFRGLELLRVAVGFCPPGKLALPVDTKNNFQKDKPQSFQDQATGAYA